MTSADDHDARAHRSHNHATSRDPGHEDGVNGGGLLISP